jgi:hypothetical protein
MCDTRPTRQRHWWWRSPRSWNRRRLRRRRRRARGGVEERDSEVADEHSVPRSTTGKLYQDRVTRVQRLSERQARRTECRVAQAIFIRTTLEVEDVDRPERHGSIATRHLEHLEQARNAPVQAHGRKSEVPSVSIPPALVSPDEGRGNGSHVVPNDGNGAVSSPAGTGRPRQIRALACPMARRKGWQWWRRGWRQRRWRWRRRGWRHRRRIWGSGCRWWGFRTGPSMARGWATLPRAIRAVHGG